MSTSIFLVDKTMLISMNLVLFNDYFLGEFCSILSVKEFTLKNYILTNFKKETNSVGKDLINVLVKQQYKIIN